MPPNEYLRARQKASLNKDDETFCAMVDGAPYFPNLVVSSQASVEDRDNSIIKVVEQLVLQTISTISDTTNIPSDTTNMPSSPLDSSSWNVTPVTGGNTNQLYCVSGVRDSNSNTDTTNRFGFPNDSLLVRLFGADGMIDRDEETSTYASLAHQKLALAYYGRFGNGRIEEMLVGWTTLTEDDLMGRSREGQMNMLPPIDLNEQIARGLAKLHATYEIPPHLLVQTTQSAAQSAEMKKAALPEPTLWTQLYPWLERSLKAEFLTERDTERAKNSLDPPLVSLKDEIDWLRSNVVGDGAASATTTNAVGIGFCHNDLLASNIMMLTKDNQNDNRKILQGLRFIDFEYGGINYYAYDIANHFNEYAGGTAVEDNSTPDYDRCPNDQQKEAFLKAYVEEYNSNNNVKANGEASGNAITVEELSAKVDGFSLANHLVWGLWGVLQAASEGCEEGLDYLHYAKCRFDRYRHDKEKIGS